MAGSCCIFSENFSRLPFADSATSPDYLRTLVAKKDLQRKETKNAEVSFFALFAPLRCALTPSLRGVLGKMAVNSHCQTRYGNREKTHE
jgi:hypothetical protein